MRSFFKQNILVLCIIAFSVMSAVVFSFSHPSPAGEWDDYSLTTASIINDGNAGISKSDVQKAKELFPEWADRYDSYQLSGFHTRNGDEMPWYFPTYSAFCVPMVLLLKLLGRPAVYAFVYTNFLSFVLMLFVVAGLKKASNKQKVCLLLALSIHPIVFYFTWISAEVFIYSFLTIGILLWQEKKYYLSAFCVAFISTMNPTILIVGIAVIISYFATLFAENPDQKPRSQLKYFWEQKQRILLFGACFLISLVPFLYNYYNTGHINLTAAAFSREDIPTYFRFFAYLFDLSFGFLPYFNLLFLASIALLVFAVLKRHWNYILLMLSFFGTVYCYSIMPHINSGMSGISRYDAWASPIMIVGVIYYSADLIRIHGLRRSAKRAIGSVFAVYLILSAGILLDYGPDRARRTNYVSFTPISAYVLDHFPALYNPLPSTFNSRVNHVDGGYRYDTPIIYRNNQNQIRKIYAAEKDREYLKDNTVGSEEDLKWLDGEVKALPAGGGYVSVGQTHEIVFVPGYTPNQKILFSTATRTGAKYVFAGLSGNEQKFSWTDGKQVEMEFKVPAAYAHHTLQAQFSLFGVYHAPQTVIAVVNGKTVARLAVFGKGILQFDFQVPSDGIINLSMKLPNAISPNNIGASKDIRLLSLQLIGAVFADKGPY